MAGNVEEWCADAIDGRRDLGTIRNNPNRLVGDWGAGHVFRGGSFLTPRRACRTTCRRGAPDDRDALDVGFRPALGS
jgi:formylglycine-generating enzyme required for sulfatase activity